MSDACPNCLIKHDRNEFCGMKRLLVIQYMSAPPSTRELDPQNMCAFHTMSTDEYLKATNSGLMAEWYSSMDNTLVSRIEERVRVQNVVLKTEKPLSIKLRVKFQNRSAESNFELTNSTMSVLIVFFTENGQKYTLLTRNFAPALGKLAFYTIPSGTINRCGRFHMFQKSAIRERFKMEDLKPLWDTTQIDYKGIYLDYTSSNKYVKPYYCEKHISSGHLASLSLDSRFKIVKLDEAFKYTSDATSLCSLMMYFKL